LRKKDDRKLVKVISTCTMKATRNSNHKTRCHDS